MEVTANASTIAFEVKRVVALGIAVISFGQQFRGFFGQRSVTVHGLTYQVFNHRTRLEIRISRAIFACSGRHGSIHAHKRDIKRMSQTLMLASLMMLSATAEMLHAQSRQPHPIEPQYVNAFCAIDANGTLIPLEHNTNVTFHSKVKPLPGYASVKTLVEFEPGRSSVRLNAETAHFVIRGRALIDPSSCYESPISQDFQKTPPVRDDPRSRYAQSAAAQHPHWMTTRCRSALMTTA